MSVGEFLGEVTSFHNRLMSEMNVRIQQIVAGRYPRNDVRIDVDGLIREHKQREQSLEEALSKPPRVKDLSLVEPAILKILELKRKLSS